MKTNISSIEKRQRKLKETKHKLETTQLNALRNLLTNEMIDSACQKINYEFRHRFLTPYSTTFHMLTAAFSAETSFQSAIHLMGENIPSYSTSKARARLPIEFWDSLHQILIDKATLDHQGTDQWKGHRLIGIDGTCVSMSDEGSLANEFGRPGAKRRLGRFPLARLGFAFGLKSLLTFAYQMGSYATSENHLFAQVMEHLKPGDLLIADRYYSGANLYVQYQRTGLDFITPAHQQLKIENLKVIKTLGKNDFLLELRIHSSHLKKDSTLPKTTVVRAIKITTNIHGNKGPMWLMTSLTDSKKYSAEEIKTLYKKRWKVETLIHEIKVWFGSDILRSQTVPGVYKELSSRVIAFNLIHYLMLEAAKKHSKDHNRISVLASIRLTISYSLKMSTAPFWKLVGLYEDLLTHMASCIIPNRPNRIEPRLVKRDKTRYAALKIPRHEWRRLYLEAA